MTDSDAEDDADSLPNPYLKEQDRGIIEAFAKEDHRVLTNTEISEHVSVHERTVRRRIDRLADDGILGKRVVSGVKLAWIEGKVKEPITVQYPLIKFILSRTSALLFVIGLAIGIVSVLILLSGALAIGYGVPIWFATDEQLLLYGVGAAVFSALFIVVGIIFAVVGWLLRYFGLDVDSQIQSLRE
jgi:hypothetical protein